MERPQKPSEEDCCNSGCNPCIFDFYEKQLKQYENYIKKGEVDKKTSENSISQLEYSQFIVVTNTRMNDTHTIITLKKCLLHDNSDCNKLWWNPGDHFLVKFKTENTACTRAYTPIKLKDIGTDSYDFSIIVKKYNNGLVSPYLFNLREGDLTFWRGPYGNYEVVPNMYKRIIMIAQGTGIAPFISIIQKILENEDDLTNLVLIYCTENIGTIFLRDELYSFQSFWNFSYNIYLSQFTGDYKVKYGEPIKSTRFEPNHLFEYKPFHENDQYLLCGSLSFMECYEKCLREENVELESIVKF